VKYNQHLWVLQNSRALCSYIDGDSFRQPCFKAFMAVTVKIIIFLVPEDGDSMFLSNTDEFLADYTVLHLRTW
jgi:hypothetical protein